MPDVLTFNSIFLSVLISLSPQALCSFVRFCLSLIPGLTILRFLDVGLEVLEY